MSNTNKERCKNCEDVEVGSIIEVEKDGRTCSFCGRDIRGFRIEFKASDTEKSLKKAYESAVPSQVEHKVFGKVHEVEDTQPSEEWEVRFNEKCTKSFAEGGFLTTDLVGDWALDKEPIKKFIASELDLLRMNLFTEVEEKLNHYTVKCRESRRIADMTVPQFMSLFFNPQQNG